MSGQMPFFVTGSSCKIKVNGVTLAYATDLNYSVAVNHVQAKVLGVYEADTIEPLAYSINGTFTVIRYVDAMNDSVKKAHGKNPNGASNYGNGIGSYSVNQVKGSSASKAMRRLAGDFSNDGKTNEALDPSRLSTSTTFDIEVYQKLPRGGQIGTSDNTISDVLQGRSAGIAPGSGTATGAGYLGVSKLRDCKITGVVTNISKRGIMTQTFSFMANYLDEDSFVSSQSGVGQQQA